MQIIINGQPREVTGGMTIAALVEELELRPSQLAVEVNRQVVPREEHAQTRLAEGDHVEIVTLVGGG